MLLKRKRSSQVKARSVVMMPLLRALAPATPPRKCSRRPGSLPPRRGGSESGEVTTSLPGWEGRGHPRRSGGSGPAGPQRPPGAGGRLRSGPGQPRGRRRPGELLIRPSERGGLAGTLQRSVFHEKIQPCLCFKQLDLGHFPLTPRLYFNIL